jgi:repressor LexA
LENPFQWIRLEPMPSKPMTSKQRETWIWIREYRALRGYSPTIHEIREHFALASTNTVAARISGLERAGWLCRDPNLKARQLIPMDANPNTITNKGAHRGNRSTRNPRDPARDRRTG